MHEDRGGLVGEQRERACPHALKGGGIAVQHGVDQGGVALHDDVQHLASNLVFGALFVGILCQVLGTGLAFSTVFLSGVLGNYVNAWLQRPDFTAIGASTALFGALGVLGGQRWQSRSRLGMSRRLIPLIACVFLFGWYGLGGDRPERVDVVGHLCGFVAGVLIGFVNGRWGARLHPGPRNQVLLALATVAVLGLAWWLALGR